MIASSSLAVVLALAAAPSPEPAPPPTPPPTEVAPPSPPAPTQPAPPPTTTAPPAGPPSSFPPPSAPPPSAAPPTATTPAPETPAPAPAPGQPTEAPAAPPPTPDPAPDPSMATPPPTEVVPAPVTVEAAPVEPAPAPTVPPPDPSSAEAKPPADVPVPTKNGRGMLITAGVLGTVGGIIKIATTISVMQQINDDQLPLSTLVGGAFFYDPFIGAAIGLAGGGMARRGRLDAHRVLFEGGEAKRPPKRGLGWGLFAGGMGLWTATRIGGLMGCGSQACVVRVWEAGYYLSLIGTVPGAIIGGHASGYHAYEKRYGKLASRVSLAPLARRGTWGLSIGGRF